MTSNKYAFLQHEICTFRRRCSIAVGVLKQGKILMTSKLGSMIGVALVSAALTGNAGAADPHRAEGFLADAQKSQQKGDPKAALIQLKNAVQADPDSGAARYELGTVEMRLGDLLSA